MSEVTRKEKRHEERGSALVHDKNTSYPSSPSVARRACTSEKRDDPLSPDVRKLLAFVALLRRAEDTAPPDEPPVLPVLSVVLQFIHRG